MPAIDVVFADCGKQRLVTGASFLQRHGECLRDRAGDRFRVVGIDQEGATEFYRGAGEAGEDEDARVIRVLSWGSECGKLRLWKTHTRSVAGWPWINGRPSQ